MAPDTAPSPAPRPPSLLSPVGALLIMLACFLACEILVRAKAADFSKNVAELRSYPQLLRNASESSSPGYIFLGNSLTGDGIADGRWKASGSGNTLISVLKVVPDGSSVWDWRCVVRQNFVQTKTSKTVVIGFAWDQLSDSTPINVAKTYGLVCGFKELFQLRHPAGLSLEQRLEGVASKLFLSYALRERIRNRLLGTVVPRFEEVAQELNSRGRGDVAAGETIDSSYLAATELIVDLRAKGYRVFVVAMPVASSYALDNSLAAAVREAGGSFVDARQISTLAEFDYKDGIHLKPEAADRFTAALAQRIAVQDL